MKVLYNLIIKKPIEQILTVLVTEGKREENMPSQKNSPRWVNAPASARKGM